MKLPKDFYFLFLSLFSIPVVLLSKPSNLIWVFVVLFLYITVDKIIQFQLSRHHSPNLELAQLEAQLRKEQLNFQLEQLRYQAVLDMEKKAARDQEKTLPSKFSF